MAQREGGAIMTETVTIHGIPGSPYVRSALLALEEKGVAYRLAPMQFGTTKSAEHLARHPFGRIPVLEHGDFRLYETQAILRYVDGAFAGPPLRPEDVRSLARMDQIIGIVDWYVLRQITVPIAAERLLSQQFWNRTPNEATIETALPDARLCVRELDRLKDGAPFMAGGAVSLADLMLAPQIAFFAATPEGQAILAESTLAEWLTRIAARPSMQATEPERLRQAA
jgi:glutathione S-transferase